jgi:hypothetical protein
MTSFSLREAAEHAGTSKSTIWRAIKSGRMSAARTDDSGFAIDPSELYRVFPPQRAGDAPTGQDATSPATDETALRSAETAALERENKLLREAVEDLRKALALADRLSLAAPIAAPGPVAPAEPEPRRSLLRYWFGWKAAG